MFVSVYCFFFKQKTAYEMRISDWSSDVCSSDLSALEDELGVAVDLDEVFADARPVALARNRLSGTAVPDAVPETPVPAAARTRVVSGTSVSVRVDLGGRRLLKKKYIYPLSPTRTLLHLNTLLTYYTHYIL